MMHNLPIIRKDREVKIPFPTRVGGVMFAGLTWIDCCCPYCKAIIRRNYLPNRIRLGDREYTCHHCGGVSREISPEWPELKLGEKLRFIFPAPIIGVLVGLGACGAFAVMLAPPEATGWAIDVTVVAVCLSPGLLWIALRLIPIMRSVHRYAVSPGLTERSLGSKRR
jgi:hypothetical protein